ncbi:unnamed protein product [Schistosoma margrebowiei]|uniref:Uncharacterized protein n=1 Tax=Schistosoma margrebowiei TaxID=48269 RepID=A0AA85A6U1_9TREM|nr:unnamed protein product [Schistosoma margrebowiei]
MMRSMNLQYLCCHYKSIRLLKTRADDNNEIEDDFEKIIDMIDKERFGPSDETDPPGWESDTTYEKEIRVGKVKKGGKLGPGKRIERVILKKKKPFGKNDSRPGFSDWEYTEEDERELFVKE